MTQAVEPRDVAEIVELRIPGKAEWVAVARLAISAVASRMKFSMEEIEDIRLAVAEACTDAIQRVAGDAQIEISCRSDDRSLNVRVRREGPIGKAEPTEAEEAVGGLGIFLVRALMDEVDYSVHPQRGTDLAMVKYVEA
jgi:serine/threonine-protein kinase RsbW